MSQDDKVDKNCINTTLYAVAASMSFKEGEEYSGGKGAVQKKEEPMWKKRLDRKVSRLRSEADILRAQLGGRVKSKNARESLERVCKLYQIDGSREAVEKALFIIKNQISVLAGRIRRYVVRCKARKEKTSLAS